MHEKPWKEARWCNCLDAGRRRAPGVADLPGGAGRRHARDWGATARCRSTGGLPAALAGLTAGGRGLTAGGRGLTAGGRGLTAGGRSLAARPDPPSAARTVNVETPVAAAICRLNRPLVPYRVGGGFIGTSLDHAGQPLVPADGGDVAQVCSSRSEHEPALPEPVDHVRGGAGREAGRWCSWPTRSGSATEAQSRVAADGAIRPRCRVRGRKLAGCVPSCLRSREAASAGQGGFVRGS